MGDGRGEFFISDYFVSPEVGSEFEVFHLFRGELTDLTTLKHAALRLSR